MSYPKMIDEYSERELEAELVSRRLARDADQCDYCGRTRSLPPCRFVSRHDGVTVRQLCFSDVTRMNLARAKRWHPGFPDDEWTLADWSNAMCGEVGEAANVVKKIRRVEMGHAGRLDGTLEELKGKLANEIADVYLYMDLLSAKADIDLQSAIVTKFNAVSEREGMPERIRAEI